MPISSGPKTELKRCVFVGPTLRDAPLDEGITRFGPAQLGSLYCAAKAGYNVIGLIDGIFGNVPSVWHKEILFALDHGCSVYGSSSLGALRAAELYRFGMRGVGIAYRLYRAGVITADDEVALLHGDETTNYTCFSEPLINARLTLRYLRRKRLLSAKQEHQAIPRFKALHFSQRTFPVYREILLSDFGACEGMRMFALLQEHYRDVKRQDAEHLLQSVLLARAARPKSSFFLRTGHWRHQFEELACELSPLR